MKTTLTTLVTLAAIFISACSAERTDTATIPGAANTPLLTVYKSPTCGCCGAWVEHMRAAGFRVHVIEESDVSPRKREFGVPPRLGSCHTAKVGDYVIEGHVPAKDVLRLLAERPNATGLAVPGMPIGSPGMEMGDRRDPYHVMVFGQSDKPTIFSTYTAEN